MEPVMDTCAGTRIGNFMSLTGTGFGYFLKRGMITMIGTMIGTGSWDGIWDRIVNGKGIN